MKKLATTLGIALLVTSLAVPVFARGRGWGMGGNWGGGPGSCGRYDREYGYQNPEERTRPDQTEQEFYNETARLREQISTKSAELDAVLNDPNPDLEKARSLQKEVGELQARMDEKRLNYELEARKNAPERSYDRGYEQGYGWGYGPHMRGFGRGMGYGHMGGYGPGMGWN